MFKLPLEVFFYLLYVEGKERYNFIKFLFFSFFLLFHEIFLQINEFVHLNKQALVEHYILWHLESQCKTTLTLSQAVPITFARMSGAQGIEDWAPPLPEVCSRLTKLTTCAKRIIVLESLLSAIIVYESEGNKLQSESEALKKYFKILVDGSPIGLTKQQQYSMKKLFADINKYIATID